MTGSEDSLSNVVYLDQRRVRIPLPAEIRRECDRALQNQEVILPTKVTSADDGVAPKTTEENELRRIVSKIRPVEVAVFKQMVEAQIYRNSRHAPCDQRSGGLGYFHYSAEVASAITQDMLRKLYADAQSHGAQISSAENFALLHVAAIAFVKSRYPNLPAQGYFR